MPTSIKKKNMMNKLGAADDDQADGADGEEEDPARNVPSSFVQVPYTDLRFRECCGEGTFGSVYRALWTTQNNLQVAVKKVNQLDKEVSTNFHYVEYCFECPIYIISRLGFKCQEITNGKN